MLRFILDMTDVPPSWLALPGVCILDALRLKLLPPGGGLDLGWDPPPPPCADLNDELAACKGTDNHSALAGSIITSACLAYCKLHASECLAG